MKRNIIWLYSAFWKWINRPIFCFNLSTRPILGQAMNNDKFRRFCEFRIENILLSHTFLGTNRICRTIVILISCTIITPRNHCTSDFLKSRFRPKGSISFLWILYKNLWYPSAKSFLIKSAMQYNNSMTDSVVALYGAHPHVITPRQYGYLRRCWGGDEPFATLCKIWSA